MRSAGPHACALIRDGSLRCWGANQFGQLGDGTPTNRLRPIPVAGLEHTASITVGPRHTCALTSAGDLRCWGSNMAGEVGDGAAVYFPRLERAAR
jgi:alpha-tubulin suppressor-like RCC1 family protein